MSSRAALVAAILLSCHVSKQLTCPEGTRVNPEREEAVRLLVAAGEAQLCFGALWPSQIITNGIYLLDERASLEETAAKVGHLSMHQKEAARFDTLPAHAEGCAAWVDGLLVLESKAYAEELRLRRELRVETNPYDFEEAFWEAPTAQREGVILTYLRTHPNGGGGVDALGAGYQSRCEQATGQKIPASF